MSVALHQSTVPSSPTEDASSALIVKSNDLINAEYNFSKIEMRIMYLMARQVQAGDEDFKTYTLRIQEFKNDLNIRSNALHERLEHIVERMIKRVIKIRSADGDLTQFPLIVRANHRNRKGIIELKFSPDLKPHMLQLGRKFTSFYDHNVMILPSTYSMRIYEFLKQFESIGWREMTIDEIRTKLEITDKYNSYNMFKKKVILKAQKDLSEHCDISFTFREIKQGRKVVALRFTINRQRQARLFDSDAHQAEHTHEGESLPALVKQLEEIGLSNEQINYYLYKEKLEKRDLQTLIDETLRRYNAGKVNNPAAYLMKLIKAGARPTKRPKRKPTNRLKSTPPLFNQANISPEEEEAINALYREFAEIRFQTCLVLTEKFTAEEWDTFIRFAKRTAGDNSPLFTKQPVDTACERFKLLIGGYLHDQLPDFKTEFIRWAKQTKKVTLAINPDVSIGFSRVVD